MQYAYFVTYLVEIQVRAGSEGKDQDSNRKIWLKLVLSNSNKSKKIHEFDWCSVSDPNALLQVQRTHDMVKCSLLKMA